MKLASRIASKEGKKSQVKIGDVREVLKIIREMIYEDPSVLIEILTKAKKK